ncbi:hypothetical protein NLJ89_g11008 [Agrocybe chaxingu]|uniref:Uncharacterized protein n=1 Tax=Agrocybe chaxingu TaxID=84603 RepID=A0A9W8MNE3_9AGAR|nr:hypothetical protein NLJ89_g11008 [Agrocybe chaxingu]
MPEPQHYQAEPHPQPSHSELQAVPKIPSRKASPVKREASVSPATGDLHRQGTTATSGGHSGASLGRSSSRRSAHTTSDGRVLPGSAFVNGAGTTGPFTTAPEEEDLYERGSEAHANLTPKQKSKIAKEEAKHGKRLTKIIKAEAKTEKQALALAIDELEELQKFQKSAVKNEGRAQANHNKLLGQFKKTEAAYLSAKMKYDTDLAHLKSEEEILETLKNNSREATERMQDKAVEVNALRETLRVDEREREVKLTQLKGKSPKSPLHCWQGDLSA